MKKIAIGLFAVLTLGLAGFTGCDGEKSSSPNSADTAWCKTKYTDETSCSADSQCKWKPAEGEKPARCAGK